MNLDYINNKFEKYQESSTIFINLIKKGEK